MTDRDAAFVRAVMMARRQATVEAKSLPSWSVEARVGAAVGKAIDAFVDAERQPGILSV